MKKLLLLLFLTGCEKPVQPPAEVKVYLISTIKYDENFIERVYLSEERAREYVELYRDHHDYNIQEITIHE